MEDQLQAEKICVLLFALYLVCALPRNALCRWTHVTSAGLRHMFASLKDAVPVAALVAAEP